MESVYPADLAERAAQYRPVRAPGGPAASAVAQAAEVVSGLRRRPGAVPPAGDHPVFHGPGPDGRGRRVHQHPGDHAGLLVRHGGPGPAKGIFVPGGAGGLCPCHGGPVWRVLSEGIRQSPQRAGVSHLRQGGGMGPPVHPDGGGDRPGLYHCPSGPGRLRCPFPGL